VPIEVNPFANNQISKEQIKMKCFSKKALLQCVLLLAVTVLFAAGCAKKPAATTTAIPETTVSEDMGQDMMQTEGLDEMALGESAIEEGASEFGVATSTVPALQSISFEFDQYTLSSEAQDVLVGNAAYLQANPGMKIRIEGYCDERGSDEYNLALGQRRALAAKNFLVSLGIDPQRLAVISYGEELPLDPTASEEAYALNRRAEFKAER
jgi:peptidoglycan-associated lipoprotein